MFITLKSSSRYSDTGMEQVVSRTALSSNPNQTQSTRRPACVPCHASKIRCKGSLDECDRCKARALSCTMPVVTHAKRARRQPPVQPSTRRRNLTYHPPQPPPEQSRRPDNGNVPSDPASSTEIPRTPTQIPEDPTIPLHISSNGDLFEDLGIGFDDIMSHIPFNIADFSGDPLQNGDADPTLNAIAPTSRQSVQDPLLTTSLYDPDHSQPLPLLPAELPPEPNQAPSHGQPDERIIPGFSLQSSESNLANPLQCSCMADIMRLVQQLDDDDFKLATHTLDQVLQLQKWIMTQCTKPLDCSQYSLSPTTHSIVLIICDRLAEMFQCFHRRIRRENSLRLGEADPFDQTVNAGWFSASGEPRADDHSAQLFDAASGRSAGRAACTSGLFSVEFRGMYSEEEQVHMIRALLRLQIKNFRSLLVRASDMCQIAGSAARRSKVEAMLSRLARAEADIDGALRVSLEFFEQDGPGTMPALQYVC